MNSPHQSRNEFLLLSAERTFVHYPLETGDRRGLAFSSECRAPTIVRSHGPIPDGLVHCQLEALLPIPAGALFLDVDGTLSTLPLLPAVRVEPALFEPAVSGAPRAGRRRRVGQRRSIADLDRLFAPVRWPAAGVHGLERRDAAGHRNVVPVADEALIGRARDRLQHVAAELPGTHVEDKGLAVALHYRQAPHLRTPARQAARAIALEIGSDLRLLEGQMVFESAALRRDESERDTRVPEDLPSADAARSSSATTSPTNRRWSTSNAWEVCPSRSATASAPCCEWPVRATFVSSSRISPTLESRPHDARASESRTRPDRQLRGERAGRRVRERRGHVCPLPMAIRHSAPSAPRPGTTRRGVRRRPARHGHDDAAICATPRSSKPCCATSAAMLRTGTSACVTAHGAGCFAQWRSCGRRAGRGRPGAHTIVSALRVRRRAAHHSRVAPLAFHAPTGHSGSPPTPP